MAVKLKRYLKKQIDAGKVDLPDELAFLADANFHAIAEQRVQYERGWYVEISGASLKILFESKRKLNAARLSNRKQAAEIKRLQDQNAALARANSVAASLKVQRDEAQNELLTKVSENEAMLVRLEQRESEIRKLEAEMGPLNAVNKQLMAIIEKDNPPDQYRNKQKNFFDVVVERGIPLAGPPIQGGKAGAGKK